ncbi:hypothetical protein JSO59_001320 [Riemerella anatipestifer]|uniref:Uncharacterized protein n=1 Tax=Riemerella anatipestifer TaxID=34085 RepID=A0AAP6HHG8_RIEAN|nr:hypothetical protein [Riemerella anatipestifer]
MSKEVTQEQINEWKQKHGEIFKITVEDKVCYLKSPDRKIMGLATSMGANEPIKFNEMVLNQCWLGGDEEIKTNDAYFFGASAQLGGIIEVKTATLEKL